MTRDMRHVISGKWDTRYPMLFVSKPQQHPWAKYPTKTAKNRKILNNYPVDGAKTEMSHGNKKITSRKISLMKIIKFWFLLVNWHYMHLSVWCQQPVIKFLCISVLIHETVHYIFVHLTLFLFLLAIVNLEDDWR